MAATIYSGSTGTLTLSGLALNGTPQTGATVVATLNDGNGNQIWGTGKILSDMGSGNYAYVFSDGDVPPPLPQAYQLIVTVTYSSYMLTLYSSVRVQNFVI